MKSACSMNIGCHTGEVKQRKIKKCESVQSDTRRGRKIGYVRVSDADQSEALQIDALKAAGCVRLYTDHGVSGAKTERAALDQMLKELKQDDTLTVWKLDRLGRSTIHLLSILEDLQSRGIHFHAITQGIDTSTAVGRMIFGQLAVFAEYERSLISERTKAGMKAAKKRGVHVGRPKMSATMERALDELTQVDIAYSVSEEELNDRIEQADMILPAQTTSKTNH
ncbi:recombinase family protein [uncultured Roseovarius sp.]|uniref:recombinase family protein n=1 Tax=uncultured Roseovarius sp. TaxID=293344 RepID=UPI002618F809|nr:recombinase family protein [uncultured Roseovarius sp.]